MRPAQEGVEVEMFAADNRGSAVEPLGALA